MLTFCKIKENTEIHKKEKLEAQQNLRRANQAQDLVDEYHILIGSDRSVNYILDDFHLTTSSPTD